MTLAHAEALGKLAAELLQVMFNAEHSNQDLDWMDMAVAAMIVTRGLAARVCAENPALPLEAAKTMLRIRFNEVMNLPDQLVRVISEDGRDGPDTAGIVPVHQH